MATKDNLAKSLRGKSSQALFKSRSKGTGPGSQARPRPSSVSSGGGGIREYTYSVEIGCDSGSTYFVYMLRDDSGSYDEDACGEVLSGTLTYVQDITITYEDIELSGFVYNGTDDLGDWGYFFGTDDLTGQGDYLVMLADAYNPGDPPQWDPEYGGLATRTQP